jgi:hypothetical protein
VLARALRQGRRQMALRPTWRLGVLTNGVPAIQARKVAALGLGAVVEVVFASAHGTGAGIAGLRAVPGHERAPGGRAWTLRFRGR